MKLYKKSIRESAIWDFSVATLSKVIYFFIVVYFYIKAIENIPIGKRPIYSGGARDESGIMKEREIQSNLRGKLDATIRIFFYLLIFKIRINVS